MSLRHGDSGTLDTGLLVRYMHGELEESHAQAISAHLADCVACRSLVSTLEADMRRASGAIREAAWDQPAPDEWNAVLATVTRTTRTRQRDRRVRIAAGWILVAGAAASLASAPVRAWIAERLAFEPAREMPPVTAAGQSDDHASLSFTPDGSELSVAIATTQAGGSLTVSFAESEKATVTVTGGGTEHLTWTGSGIRIANGADAQASYRIEVSRSIERVLVRIGDAEALSFDRTVTGERPVEIELHSGSVRNETARDEP
jgi:hypothetical protein